MEAVRQQRIENRRITRPKLEVLVKGPRGVPFVEGLRMAEKRGLVIASNRRLDKVLIESNDEWKSISDAFPCWSGTMTGYEKPGKKLGKYIEYYDDYTRQRYVFPVPEDYKGARNVILAVEHPDYALDRDGNNLVITVQNIKSIGLIENFPTFNGWYLTDEKYGIPIGNEVDVSYFDRPQGARSLLRIAGPRVGPVARRCSYNDDYSDRRVGLDIAPSGDLVMVVKATKNNTKEGDGK